MKFINKSDLEFRDGFLVHGDDVVMVSAAIVYQANKLDEVIQRKKWEDANSVDPMLVRERSEFNRKSMFDVELNLSVDTPTLDAKIEESKRLSDDIKQQAAIDDISETLSHCDDLVQFIVSDKVLASDDGVLIRFDLPILGNPLELTIDSLVNELGGCYDLEVMKPTEE